MNIVLIGMRGSGKSTLGIIFAKKIGTDLIETDSLIEKKAGMKIKDIVSKRGWNYFRNLEEEVIKTIAALNNMVIATGGGVILNQNNIRLLKKDGLFIYLETKEEELIKRISDAKGRPFLTSAATMKDDIENTFKVRKKLYEGAADMMIDTEKVNLGNLKPNTNLFGVIGNPVSQSLSPIIHNTAFKVLKLHNIFLPLQIINLSKSLVGLKMLKVMGISVTIPHKIEVLKHIDEIDPIAQSIGAVNTIVNINGKMVGSNTDWIGAIKALEEKTTIEGKKIALLGTGGAARAIAYGLKSKKALVKVFDRNEDHARKIVQDFHLEGFGKLDSEEQIHDCEIIINATSVGMTPNENSSPIPSDLVTNHHIVFDIVFKPKETLLLQIAKKKNATIVYGERMLLYQAAEQFKLFTGLEALLDSMEKAMMVSS